MRTVGDLKKVIENLPDDMVVLVAGEDSWEADVDVMVLGPNGKILKVTTAILNTPLKEQQHIAALYVEPRP